MKHKHLTLSDTVVMTFNGHRTVKDFSWDRITNWQDSFNCF